ncbi:amino acid permease [Burkholderia humptydooensis]|uniref:Virulence sensor protein BvgS n=2 Tax=Burkholderia humptydooensis TaxID=430531 RepID=A0A7U4P9S2_9BURK|nr:MULTISPECIES: amino acid permease [Burkholderia]AJY39894.1 amino acid permease family protein [Burkholderia sp. 2002721687]ALX45581.1 hybrid sensor histidine kinase/response regulator [Burkholderia humptydooensis]EIP86527.1 Signal transduction histidine kinase [Burkholderia humptydooensis MSMB43]QPS47063.1 amino acid permease [Burkholderia humptydooensis]
MEATANETPRRHPRTLGWVGTTALAMGGSNQSLFLLAALFAGQGDIPGQGSAAVPLLIVGLLLSYAAAPGWIELVLMSPTRVGGIAAACTEAFRRYGEILSTLAGACYWWGWVPACGLTAIFSATAINEWYLPGVPVTVLACALVAAFTFVNLCGIRWVTRLAIPIATASAGLAFISAIAPVMAGTVDWHRAADFHLTTPFAGHFGELTSLMAGLYLIGFAAPAFEAATCHVGETADQNRNVPRAMLASAAMAGLYFAVLPGVWLGLLGPGPLGQDLGQVLGPSFAPVFGSLAKAAAIWFMMFNMFHGTIQPLAGASRTLAQLSEDGVAPRFLALRNRADVPWCATLVTAGFSLGLLLLGDPVWLLAAANFTYLTSIFLCSVAVWLLRRDAPLAHRPYRAPRGTIGLGLAAAGVWMLSGVLGFEQYGLPTVVCGLAFAYSGAALFAWRKWEDRRRAGLPGIGDTLHFKLTGAMLLVLALDGAGYMLAISQIARKNGPMETALEDIFVAVAMLTVTVGIVLPGMIAHSADELSRAARRLATGTLKDFSNAMSALGRGDLDGAYANFAPDRLRGHGGDELGRMAESFNMLQSEIGIAATGLGDAREGLRRARSELTNANLDLQRAHDSLEERVRQRTRELQEANRAKSIFLANMSHELRTPLNAILGYAQWFRRDAAAGERQVRAASIIKQSGEHLLMLITDILDLAKIEAGKLDLCPGPAGLDGVLSSVMDIIRVKSEEKGLACVLDAASDLPPSVWIDDKRLRQVLLNLLGNAVKFTSRGRVELRVSLLQPADELARVRFEVRDTGVGIAHDRLTSIFDPFEQAGEAQSRAGGTGLGLSISRQLVRLMGGEIEVESEPGAGSRFWFDLELAVVEVAPARAQPAQSITGYQGARRRRLLVVDDIDANRSVLRDTLGALGFDIDEAVNGVEAIHAAENDRPDLILMDICMPVMNGMEATRRIREIPALRDVPIIAVSASATPEDAAAALAAGASMFLPKPVDHDRLLGELGTLLGLQWRHEAPGSNAERAGDTPSIEPMAIPDEGRMAHLYRLALAGNMRAIRLWAEELITAEPQCRVFADRLTEMAKGCRSEAILRLVETYINPAQVTET